MTSTDPNAFDPNHGMSIPLDADTPSESLVPHQHFHTTPVKVNVPDEALAPVLSGRRGVVSVAACGLTPDRPIIFTPIQARAHALTLLAAADVADLGHDDEGIGQALAESLMAGGDPGNHGLGVDEEGNVLATVFEMADGDGDKLLLSLPINGGMAAVVALLVTDDEGDSFEASVALTKDQAGRLAKLLATYSEEN
jgi:hypothetical protein